MVKGDKSMITEIIFSDYYRTFLLCILSMVFAFSMRNASIRKKVFAFAGYEFTMCIPFFWILIVCTIVTDFYYESIIAIVKWGLMWIFYFTISTILLFVMYSILWKKNNILKIATLLFSIIIVIVPLYVININ